MGMALVRRQTGELRDLLEDSKKLFPAELSAFLGSK
jgi:hypothetical protein